MLNRNSLPILPYYFYYINPIFIGSKSEEKTVNGLNTVLKKFSNPYPSGRKGHFLNKKNTRFILGILIIKQAIGFLYACPAGCYGTLRHGA